MFEFEVQIDASALYRLREQLKKAGRDDKAALWDRVRPRVAQMIDDIFTSQVDSSGQPWPEHSPATVAMYGEHPLLILTGAMYDDLVGSGAIQDRRSNNEISWGTDQPYAQTHQYGSNRVPRREFLYWRQDAIEDIAEMAEQYMMDTYFYEYK